LGMYLVRGLALAQELQRARQRMRMLELTALSS
jgi:hypothetical protein